MMDHWGGATILDAHAHDPCDAKSGSLGGTRKVRAKLILLKAYYSVRY